VETCRSSVQSGGQQCSNSGRSPSCNLASTVGQQQTFSPNKNGDPKAAMRNIIMKKPSLGAKSDFTTRNYMLASIWEASYCGNYLLTLFDSGVVMVSVRPQKDIPGVPVMVSNAARVVVRADENGSYGRAVCHAECVRLLGCLPASRYSDQP